MEIPMLFLSLSAGDILRKALQGLSLVLFSLLKLSFLAKTQPKITRCGFCHVYGSTGCFQIVNNATETTFAADEHLS